MLFIEDLVGGFVLDLERVGWVVDDPRFWEPEPDIGDRPPTSEKCQEEEKTKHICIKQPRRGYKGEPFAQKDFGTMNNSNLGTNMKKCLEHQPVQEPI